MAVGALGQSPPEARNTVRVAVPVRPQFSGSLVSTTPQDAALDPQRGTDLIEGELWRCCLTRTLYSWTGQTTAQGGTVLRPDLATGPPQVSADERTWTFHLKAGLRYGPPLQDVEITSGDFVRALERDARVGEPTAFAGGVFAGIFSDIRGFASYARGAAGAISGLETPDAQTLRVHLVHPLGYLAWNFTYPPAAPIPPSPRNSGAPYGAATGHDRLWGRFLVSSGPYMIEGSQALDLTRPAAEQTPISGFQPARSLVLVRNPSWSRSSDALRPALADRIEPSIGGTPSRGMARQDGGRADLVIGGGPPAAGQIARYRARPALGRVEVEPNNSVRFLTMNLAVPPFDDLHVRRAISLVLDKPRMLSFGGAAAGVPAGHIGVDSGEAGLLTSYDPFATPGDRGSVRRARAEMRLSRYDPLKDGLCDVTVCRGVLAIGYSLLRGRLLSAEIRRDLARIGIGLRLESLPAPQLYEVAANPRRHVGAVLTVAFLNSSGDPSGFFSEFTSAEIGPGGDYSLLGASPAQLRRWRYAVTRVPSADDRFQACARTLAETAARCWARLDEYLTENVIPAVPYAFERSVQVVPRRVSSYSYDALLGQPALDRVAVSATP